MHLKAVSPLHHIHLVNILFACTPTPLDGPFGPEENWWVGRISLSVEYSVLRGLVPLDRRKYRRTPLALSLKRNKKTVLVSGSSSYWDEWICYRSKLNNSNNSLIWPVTNIRFPLFKMDSYWWFGQHFGV